jgi:hypothetical protein
MYFRTTCKEYIPQRSQWKKLSRPPILQIPQESQWYCCFFVCQNTWGEHIAHYNSKQGSCVLNSKTSKPEIIEQLESLMDRLLQDLQREEDVNLIIKEFADWTEVFTHANTTIFAHLLHILLMIAKRAYHLCKIHRVYKTHACLSVQGHRLQKVFKEASVKLSCHRYKKMRDIVLCWTNKASAFQFSGKL